MLFGENKGNFFVAETLEKEFFLDDDCVNIVKCFRYVFANGKKS